MSGYLIAQFILLTTINTSGSEQGENGQLSQELSQNQKIQIQHRNPDLHPDLDSVQRNLEGPLDSKNKAKDPFTRAAYYASKRITRATAKLISPPTSKRVFELFP